MPENPNQKKKAPRYDASVARVVDDELQKLGWSPNARLSFLGDLGRENGWNRNVIFGGHADPKNGATNRGIVSWQGDRRANLNRYLKNQGLLGKSDDNELRGMVRFMDDEMRGSNEWKRTHSAMRDPNISTAQASENLRKYIKYSTDPKYNTPDPEFRVKNNRDWAMRAKQLGLGGNSTVPINSYAGNVTPVYDVPEVTVSAPQSVPERFYTNDADKAAYDKKVAMYALKDKESTLFSQLAKAPTLEERVRLRKEIKDLSKQYGEMEKGVLPLAPLPPTNPVNAPTSVTPPMNIETVTGVDATAAPQMPSMQPQNIDWQKEYKDYAQYQQSINAPVATFEDFQKLVNETNATEGQATSFQTQPIVGVQQPPQVPAVTQPASKRTQIPQGAAVPNNVAVPQSTATYDNTASNSASFRIDLRKGDDVRKKLTDSSIQYLTANYGVTAEDAERALNDFPIKFADGSRATDTSLQIEADNNGFVEHEIMPSVIKRAQAYKQKRLEFEQKSANVAQRVSKGENQLDAQLQEGLINQDQYNAAQAEIKKAQDEEAEARKRFEAENPQQYQPMVTPSGDVIDTPYSQQTSKEKLDEILAKYGSATQYYKEQRLKMEAWKKIAENPNAFAKEFGTNLLRAIPKAASSVAKTISIGAEGIDLGLKALSNTTAGNLALGAAGNWYANTQAQDVPAEQRGFYQVGQTIDRITDEYLPQDELLKRNFLATVLPDTVGQLLVQLGVGTVTGGVGAPLLVGASQGASAQYEEAAKFGADQKTKLLSAFVGGLAAVPDAIPLSKWLSPLNAAEKTGFVSKLLNSFFGKAVKEVGEEEAQTVTRQLLKNMALGGLMEGTQEVSENKINDLLASLTYDKKRKVLTINDEDIESFLGGFVGGAVGGGVETAGQMSQPQMSKEDVEKAVAEEYKNAITTNETNNNGIETPAPEVLPQPTQVAQDALVQDKPVKSTSEIPKVKFSKNSVAKSLKAKEGMPVIEEQKQVRKAEFGDAVGKQTTMDAQEAVQSRVKDVDREIKSHKDNAENTIVEQAGGQRRATSYERGGEKVDIADIRKHFADVFKNNPQTYRAVRSGDFNEFLQDAWWVAANKPFPTNDKVLQNNIERDFTRERKFLGISDLLREIFDEMSASEKGISVKESRQTDLKNVVQSLANDGKTSINSFPPDVQRRVRAYAKQVGLTSYGAIQELLKNSTEEPAKDTSVPISQNKDTLPAKSTTKFTRTTPKAKADKVKAAAKALVAKKEAVKEANPSIKSLDDFYNGGYELPSGLKKRGVVDIKEKDKNTFDVTLANGTVLRDVKIDKSLSASTSPITDNLSLLKPSNSLQIAYNGKSVDVDMPFARAAQKVRDNLTSGEVGYVQTAKGQVFEITQGSKKAKLIKSKLVKETPKTEPVTSNTLKESEKGNAKEATNKESSTVAVSNKSASPSMAGQIAGQSVSHNVPIREKNVPIRGKMLSEREWLSKEKGIDRFYVSNKPIARYEESGSKRLSQKEYNELEKEYKSYADGTNASTLKQIPDTSFSGEAYEKELASIKVEKDADGNLLAPNGKKSNLNEWFADSQIIGDQAKLDAFIASSEPPVAKSRPDGSPSDSKFVADLLVSPTFRSQGLSGFKIPSQRVVLHSVISLRNDPEVLRAVVQFIPVNVMDILKRQQIAPNQLLSNEAVLKKSLSANSDGSVTTAVDIANALVRAVASVGAKRLVASSRVAGIHGKLNPASKTSISNSSHTPIIPTNPDGSDGEFSDNGSILKQIADDGEISIDSLSNKNGELNYDKIQDVAGRIERGEYEITRLDKGSEQGRIRGGRRNVEASLVIGASESAVQKTSASNGERVETLADTVKRQERVLEQYAKRNDIWFKQGHFPERLYLGRGGESIVYQKDENRVVKLVDYRQIDKSMTPLRFIDSRISAFNALFPASGYELSGFMQDQRGNLRFVLTQPLIQGTPIQDQSITDAAMLKRGLVRTGKESYSNSLYEVHDIHNGNVLAGANGTVFVIDAVPKIKNAPAPFGIRKAERGEDGTLKQIANDTPVFYSQVQRAIENSPQTKFSPDQAKALFKNAKQEELDWLGLPEWIDEQKGAITKNDLLQFVRENQVELKEVVKGEGELHVVPNEDEPHILEVYRADDPDGSYAGTVGEIIINGKGQGNFQTPQNKKYAVNVPSIPPKSFDTQREAENYIKVNTDLASETKFSQYTLPNGENYKELLLTMPEVKIKKSYEKWLNENWTGIDDQEARNLYKIQQEPSQNYRSSHWDEPNVLAHIRFDERTDANGRKTLHIAEIQSDWSQQLRQEMPLIEVSKPQSIRKLGENFFGGELATKMPLSVMDGSVLTLLNHDKIRKAVVSDILVDVMDDFNRFKISPNDFLRNPSMVFKNLPVDHRLSVAKRILNSARLVGTSIRTELSRATHMKGDVEILPTIKASDLTAREIVGVLSPSSIYHNSVPFSTEKSGSATLGAEASNLSTVRENVKTLPANRTEFLKTSLPTLSGTELGRNSARLDKESRVTSIADLLNWHNNIISKGDSSKQVRYIDKGTPQTPFTKTETWAGIGFKKALRFAVENNFDAISWDTGATNAERYDLSKHINQIEYWYESPNSIWVDVYDKNDSRISDASHRYKPEELEGTFGKEIAEKIINRENLDEEGGDSGSLSGLDLKVGGEGMKGFYDKILPSFANKYVKKWGAKVERENVITGSGKTNPNLRYQVNDVNGEYVASYPNKTDADARAKSVGGNVVDTSVEITPTHSIAITPEMKASVMQGQPLFKITTADQSPDKVALSELAAKESFTDDDLKQIEVETDGDVVTLSLMGGELVRTADELMTKGTRSKTSQAAGQFLKPTDVTRIADGLDILGETFEENGQSRAELDAVRDAILEAAKGDGSARLQVYKSALPHETRHKVSWKFDKSESKVLANRVHDLPGFVKANQEIIDKAFNNFFKKHGYTESQAPTLVEELWAYTSTGDYERLGLSDAEAADYVVNWLQAYEKQHGEDALNDLVKFIADQEDAQDIIERANDAKNKTKEEQNRADGKGISEEQKTSDSQTKGNDAETLAADEENRRLPADGELTHADNVKQRQYAETLRENGRTAYQDTVDYVPESEKGWTANAKKIIEDSRAANPADPYRQAIDEFNNSKQPESFRAVLGVALIDHLGADGMYDEMRKIADSTVKVVGTAGQALRASQIVSKYDFAKGIEIAQKGLKQAGMELTDDQIDEVKRKTMRYAAAADNEAVNTSILEEIKTELEHSENRIKELETAYSELSDDNEKKIKDLAEAKKQGQIAKRLATYYKNIVENGRQARTRAAAPKAVREELAKTKDADVQLLRDLFGDSAVLKVVAWHGSPHVFDKFSLDKIGTGEGAQAYGYGLYFASDEKIADYYKKALESEEAVMVLNDGTKIYGNALTDDMLQATKYLDMGRKQAGEFTYNTKYWALKNAERLNAPASQVAAIKEYGDDFKEVRYEKVSGRKYKVDLKPSEDQYLLWDKPLSEQSEKVRKAIQSLGYNLVTDSELESRVTDSVLDAYDSAEFEIQESDGEFEVYINGEYDTWFDTKKEAEEYAQKETARLDAKAAKSAAIDAINNANLNDYLAENELRGDEVTGADLYNKILGSGKRNSANEMYDQADASDRLLAAGVRGNKYLDGTSRNKGEGSYNYVIFDDSDVEILQTLKQIAPESEKPLTPEQRAALVRQVQRSIVDENPVSYDDLMKQLAQITHGQVSENTLRSIHAEAVNGIKRDAVDVEGMDEKTRAAYEKQKAVRKVRRQHRAKAKAFERSLNDDSALSPINRKIIAKIDAKKDLSADDKKKLITATRLSVTVAGAKAWNEGFTEAYGLTQSENNKWFVRAVEMKKELRNDIKREQMGERAKKANWEGSIPQFENTLLQAQKAKRDAQRSLDAHYRELQKKRWERVVDKILFVPDLMRTLMSTGEVSQIGRQGYPTLLTFPKAWTKSLKGLQTGLGNQTQRFSYIKAIEADPDFQESVRYGMPYATFGENAVGDEHFPIERMMTRLSDKDYKISKLPVVGTVLSKAAKAQMRFEHAYTDPADLQRLGVYKAFKSIIDSQSLTDDQADTAKKRAVYYAKILSGKGSLPSLFGERSFATRMLASLGFAPNLLASRVETAFHFNPILAPVLAPKGLKTTMVKKSLQLYTVPAVLALALSAIFKPTDVDDKDASYLDVLNPMSKRFLKVTIRGTDINLDVSSGMGDFQRVMFYDWANLIYSGIKDGKDGFVNTAMNLAKNEQNSFLSAKFLRGKLSPIASLGVDVTTGSDFVGHPINWEEGGYWGAVTSRMTPLTYQHIYDALFYDEAYSLTKEPQTATAAKEKLSRFKMANILPAMALGTLEAVGLSANQYEKVNNSAAVDTAWTLYSKNFEAKNPQLSRVKTELRNLFRKRDTLERAGKDTSGVDKVIDELKAKYEMVTPKDIATIKEQVRQGKFDFVTKQMDATQIRQIMQVATDAEKVELQKILDKKLGNGEKKETKTDKLRAIADKLTKGESVDTSGLTKADRTRILSFMGKSPLEQKAATMTPQQLAELWLDLSDEEKETLKPIIQKKAKASKSVIAKDKYLELLQ